MSLIATGPSPRGPADRVEHWPIERLLAAAVSGDPFICVAGQELIQFATEIAVAVIAHAIEPRRLASEATKSLRNDMFNPTEPVWIGLVAIDADLVVQACRQ